MEYRCAPEVLDLAQQLIRIPSTKENLDASYKVLNLVKENLPDAGYEEFFSKDQNGQLVPSIVFFNRDTRPDKFRVLLHGHLDVVLAQSETMFTPTIEGSRLYGRGSEDMKAAASVLIHVFKDMAEDIEYPLGLSLTTDEELGGLYGAQYQVENGVLADFVISGEPTALQIGNQHKGLLSLDLQAQTKGGHSAYDGEAENALLQVMAVQMSSVSEYPAPDGEWRTTCSPSITATTNRTNNMVPADAMGRLSIRYIPQDNPETILQTIAAIDPRVLVKRFSESAAHFTDPSHPDIRCLSRAVQSVVEAPTKLRSLPHSSDVVHWATAGTAAVDFGPSGAGMHTSDEYVEIDSLGQYSTILKTFLSTLV